MELCNLFALEVREEFLRPQVNYKRRHVKWLAVRTVNETATYSTGKSREAGQGRKKKKKKEG